MNPDIHYVATLSSVRELTLHGSADLVFWREQLQAERLYPVAGNGRAQLLLIGAEARFHGIAFRELSVSVLVSQTADALEPDGAFLVQAFNTRRCFAWAERFLFKTPYRHAEVGLCAELPLALSLSVGQKTVFRAEMVDSQRDPRRQAIHQGLDGWQGRVFLPTRGSNSPWGRRWFMANIQGDTQSYPASDHTDCWMMHAHPACPVFQMLVDSEFRPNRWSLRPAATHAKSKTYRQAG